MKKLISPYRGPEKNCGDRMKILNLQTWDMCDRHNLQIYEILSVIKTIVNQQESELKNVRPRKTNNVPRGNSSCGDDYKTKTKYNGPEKTLGAVISVCEQQIKDLFLIDDLNSSVINSLVKDLVEEHIDEVDEFKEKS